MENNFHRLIISYLQLRSGVNSVNRFGERVALQKKKFNTVDHCSIGSKARQLKVSS